MCSRTVGSRLRPGRRSTSTLSAAASTRRCVIRFERSRLVGLDGRAVFGRQAVGAEAGATVIFALRIALRRVVGEFQERFARAIARRMPFDVAVPVSYTHLT